MKKYFRFISKIARAIPTPEFSPITYWRHSENKYLYLCMSKTHIKTDERSTGEEKFLEVFPKAIRISQIEFDLILYFNSDIEVVNVADDNILSMISREDEFLPEREIPSGGFLANGDYPMGVTEKDIDGHYAENEHEESEDKNISNE